MPTIDTYSRQQKLASRFNGRRRRPLHTVYVVVVQKFTFAVSSPDEFLFLLSLSSM